jgi:flagellar biogenesis protein FliO
MAKLLTGTRIYGTANVDSVLVVGNVTSNNSTSNTTGSLIVTGGMGITGNVFMSAGNNWQSTTSSQSYRLGWTDNYFMRAAQFGGIDFTGTYLNITSTFYTSSLFYSRGLIANDSGGNNTVLFAGSSPVRLQNTAASTSNTTGSLIVGGGVGVSGNIWVGGTNAGANGVYTDVLRYAANGLPWVMNTGGGGGGGTIDQWVRDTANVTIGVDASQNVRLDFSNTRMNISDGVDASQNVRLDFSNTAITIVQGVDVGQNSRMVIIEGVDVGQNSRMTIADGVDASQNVRIDYSNTAITIVQGVDVGQNSRMTIIEGTNASQNVRIDYSNTAITIVQGVDVGQNSRMTIIEGTDVSQNARMTISDGVNASQNVRLDYSNTALTIMQGVDNSQNVRLDFSNTAINATDGKMSSAYNQANTGTVLAQAAFNQANTGGGGGIAFSKIIVSGQPDAIANIANSPLTLVAGTNLTITSNGISNTITINALSVSNTTIANVSLAAAFSTYYLGLTQQSGGELKTAYVDTANLFYTTANGTLFVTNYNTSSDKNLKDDIITITDGLTTVDKLRGVSFKWKNSGEKSYGIIAQELEEILPDLVSNAGGHKSVNYNALIGFLIEAVKELSDRVDELEKK